MGKMKEYALYKGEEFIDIGTKEYLAKLLNVRKETIKKAIELLGNYKHYSTPDEKQNSDNEDLVNNVFDILKEVSE